MLQAVFPIPPENRARLAPLYPGANGLVRACLFGQMGQAFGDHPLHPGAALLCVGDFACFGGDPKRHAAGRLAGRLARNSEKTWIIPALAGWEEHIAFWRPKRMERNTRYAVSLPEAGFDLERLTALTQTLPAGIALRPMEAALYEKAMAAPWSRDFCSQFDSAGDYAKRGLGVAAVKAEEIVAGASSYVAYGGGIEIQTDTREDMRRRGLAAACCAKLILACLEKRLTPTWDAANPASLALAQKLGYRPGEAYPILEVTF